LTVFFYREGIKNKKLPVCRAAPAAVSINEAAEAHQFINAARFEV
jgi:hypothetical protein